MPTFKKSRPYFRVQGFKNTERYLNYEGELWPYLADGLLLDEIQIQVVLTDSRQVRKLMRVLETIEPSLR